VKLVSKFIFYFFLVLYNNRVIFVFNIYCGRVCELNAGFIFSIKGGMKAVVWTDTFQVLVLYSSMLAILWKGTVDLGGFGVVWERNAAMNRTELFK